MHVYDIINKKYSNVLHLFERVIQHSVNYAGKYTPQTRQTVASGTEWNHMLWNRDNQLHEILLWYDSKLYQ